MIRGWIIGVALAVGGVCLGGAQAAAPWKLVWAEEFSRPGLPEARSWRYEVGYIRNNELQYYTRERLENARIEEGILTIEGRKEQFPNPGYRPGADPKDRRHAQFADYTAASINTFSRTNFLYGRIEVRARLPHGKGVWPAIWMMGTNHNTIGWPKCGEIDIMEFVGKEPGKVHATVHYFGEGKHQQMGGQLEVIRPWVDFHLYAVEWYPDRMEFYFDQHKYFTFPLDKAGAGPENPFRKPHFLMVNLALGGSWGGPMDDAVLPQKFQVDYVRVYQAGQAAQ